MKMLATLLLAALSLGAVAEGRTYAVMSIVGDGLLVVHHRAGTGSFIDHDQRDRLPMADPVFDRVALRAVDRALHAAQPEARTILLAGHDPAVLEAQARGIDGDAALQAVVDVLRPRLPAGDATHLVLVTKQRGPAMLKLQMRNTGSGTLEGLGFYVDRDLPTHKADTGEKGRGFLAPFAYFCIALVDLSTGQVVSRQIVQASTTLSTARSATLDPWDALSAEDKLRTLEALITRETARVVPALLRER